MITRQIPDEVDPSGFQKNLEECSAPLQEMVTYLRSTARNAGADVSERRYRHPKPNSGWGVAYYADSHRFCEFNPKREKDHVWAFVHGADSSEIADEGFQPSLQDGWFQIRTLPEAVRFVKWVLLAHDGPR